MKVKKYFPSTILKPFINYYLIIETEDESINKILPDTSVIMAFRFKGDTFQGNDKKENLPRFALSGISKSVKYFNYSKNTANFLIKFKEGGAYIFFREPLNNFSGLHISLDNLIHQNELRKLEELLVEAENNYVRVSLVENFLISKLVPYNFAKQKTDNYNLIVLKAVEKIKLAKGSIRIKKLTDDLSISIDPFEKKFRQIIGTSPKHFSTIIRLRNLINNYSSFKNLTEAALSANYFDQAHFIKDFKFFTGQTPKEFFAFPNFW